MTEKEVAKGLKAIVSDRRMWKQADYYAMVCKEALAIIKRKAEWEEKPDAWGCSGCGINVSRKSPYCPECGARMKNGERIMELV